MKIFNNALLKAQIFYLVLFGLVQKDDDIIKEMLDSTNPAKVRAMDTFILSFSKKLLEKYFYSSSQEQADINYFNRIEILSNSKVLRKSDVNVEASIDVIKAADTLKASISRYYALGLPFPPLLASSPHLKNVSLTNFGISKYTKQMVKCTKIARLELKNCNVYDLDTILPKNSRIKEIVLDSCRISIEQIDPELIQNLTSIEIVNCQLNAIPKAIFLVPTLKKMVISKNCIKSLPSLSAKDPISIEELDLSYNLIGSFPSEIQHFPKLKKLDLSWNLIKDCKYDFSKNPFESINLSGNLFSTFEFNEKSFNKLKSLNLSYCPISKINKNIFFFEKMETVNLGHCKITEFLKPMLPLGTGDESLAILGNMLDWLTDTFNLGFQLFSKETSSSIKSVDISYNCLFTLPAFFQNFLNIEKLNCAGNEFTEIPQMINRYKKLEYLDFSYNLLEDLYFLTARDLKIKVLDISGGISSRHPKNRHTNDIKTVPKKLFEYINGDLEIVYTPGTLDQDSTLEGYGEVDLRTKKIKK